MIDPQLEWLLKNGVDKYDPPSTKDIEMALEYIRELERKVYAAEAYLMYLRGGHWLENMQQYCANALHALTGEASTPSDAADKP